MEAREVKKLYYSIGEVSEITGLKQYVLRYWETEFSHIRPTKNRAGNRVYRSTDLNNIKELKNLLHSQKFTIKGAKQYLRNKEASVTSSEDPKVLKLIDTLDIKTLKNIQKSLNDLLSILDSNKKRT